MKYFAIKICLILVCVAILCGCGIDYTKQLAGTYVAYNDRNEIINENTILKLSPNGNFSYDIEKRVIFQGKWNASEVKEMTTVDFHTENREWKNSGGSFNPPQCNQIIVWNPKYFNLSDSIKIIFKKR